MLKRRSHASASVTEIRKRRNYPGQMRLFFLFIKQHKRISNFALIEATHLNDIIAYRSSCLTETVRPECIADDNVLSMQYDTASRKKVKSIIAF